MQKFKLFLILSFFSVSFSTISFANKVACRLIATGNIFNLNNYVTDNQIGYDDFVSPDENGRTPAELAEATGNPDMISLVNDIEIELRDNEPTQRQFKFEEEVGNSENGNPNFFAIMASPRGSSF